MAKANFLDDLAELGARAARAPRGLILKRENATNTVSVVGRYGCLFEPSEHQPLPSFIYPDADFLAIPDVRADARLVGHPMLEYVPRVNSVIVAKISPDLNYTPRYTFTLLVWNSDAKAFEVGEGLGAITHVVNVCRQFVSALGHDDAFMAEESAVPFPAFVPSHSALAVQNHKENGASARAANYLIDTLPRKHVLHENETGGFISLRTWRRSIKDQQFAAFVEATRAPPEEFLDFMASELSESAHKIFGSVSIQTVVPLPARDNSMSGGLSEIVSRRVAKQLGVKFANAFEYEPDQRLKGTGKSNSKTSLSFNHGVAGGVLLLGDFSASAEQIGAAQSLVRKSGSSCFAMSWLGPT